MPLDSQRFLRGRSDVSENPFMNHGASDDRRGGRIERARRVSLRRFAGSLQHVGGGRRATITAIVVTSAQTWVR